MHCVSSVPCISHGIYQTVLLCHSSSTSHVTLWIVLCLNQEFPICIWLVMHKFIICLPLSLISPSNQWSPYCSVSLFFSISNTGIPILHHHCVPIFVSHLLHCPLEVLEECFLLIYYGVLYWCINLYDPYCFLEVYAQSHYPRANCFPGLYFSVYLIAHMILTLGNTLLLCFVTALLSLGDHEILRAYPLPMFISPLPIFRLRIQ